MPAAGVPARVAVPLPLSMKVTPVGRAPVSDKVMSELVVLPSVALTVKVPAVPTPKLGVVGRGDRRRRRHARFSGCPRRWSAQ